MQVECPHCQKAFEVSDSQGGQIVTCPACGGQMQLPAPSAPAAPAAPTDRAAPPAFGGGPRPGSRDGGGMPLGEGALTTAAGISKPCPYCGESILAAAQKCRHCGTYLSGPMAGREVRSPGTASGEATSALVLGILGLVLGCIPAVSLIMGALAVHLGGKARRADPKSGAATAGFVLGIIDCVLGGLYLLLFLVGMASD